MKQYINAVCVGINDWMILIFDKIINHVNLIKTPEQAEKRIGMKVAGIIPDTNKLRENSDRWKNILIYHILKSLYYSNDQQRILIICTQPAEGKRTVCEMMKKWLFYKGKKCEILVPHFENGRWLVSCPTIQSATLEDFVDKDFLIMEMPTLLNFKYPVELIQNFTAVFLVCNAKRQWKTEDDKILNRFVSITGCLPKIILNNVRPEVLNTFNTVQTYFAPSERTKQHVIRHQYTILKKNKQVHEIVKSMPNLCVILDKNRQIVYANDAISSSIGLRPGELISCVNSDMMPAGCGTAPACRNCGIVRTVLECMKSRKREEGEYPVNKVFNGQNVEALYKIVCIPFEVNNDFFVITNLAEQN
jgi:PAS domain-containing protein